MKTQDQWRCPVGWRCPVLIVILAMVFLPGAHTALARPFAMELTQVWVDLPYTQEVVCYLDVLDESRELVHGVTADELSAILGEHDLTVDEVAPFADTGEGTAYTVMLDISSAMSGEPFEHALDGVRLLIDDLQPHDLMALWTFGDSVHTLQDFTNERGLLRTALDGLTAEDSESRLFSALNRARRANQRSERELPRRRVIVVISDGRDEGSGLTIEDLFRERLAIEPPIFSLGHTRIAERHLENLIRLSELTHGTYVRVHHPEDFQGQFRRIQGAVRRPYRVTMTAPPELPFGEARITMGINRAGRGIRASSLTLVGGIRDIVEADPQSQTSVTVDIEPDEAAAAGAQWRIGESDWLDSGETSPLLPPGVYLIEFIVEGAWAAPEPMEITLAPGEHVRLDPVVFEARTLMQQVVVFVREYATRPVVYIPAGLIAILLMLMLIILLLTRGEKEEPVTFRPMTDTEEVTVPPTEDWDKTQPPRGPGECGVGGMPFQPPPDSTGLEGGEVAQPMPKQPKVNVELVVLDGPDSDKRFKYSIGTKALRLGRGAACELRLSDTHVSEVHCELSADGEYIYITDKGSRNGTIVNGVKTRGKCTLRDKDTFVIGETHIRVLL